ncbi:MAG: squalene/phytoene synthase family protein [Proteobacteria bacterium]|nr:squalene/phytoene synthase family protein [Pseudomonadota bacterium]
MSETAFDSYLSRWREADPQRATAWLFLRPAERTRFGALAALEEEWLKAVRDAREPQVAATKLGWWREEMQRAVQGEIRHPLLQPLFADARVRAVPVTCWTAAVDASLLALGAPPPANGAAQLAAARPLAAAFADLETRIWFGARAEAARAAAVIAVAQLVSSLRSLGTAVANARVPLPMNLMARHGLTLDDLTQDGQARRSALRDHAVDLERELARAATMEGPLSLFRAVGLQHDLHGLRRAARAADPLAALQQPEHGFRHLLKTWQAARIWRGYRFPETSA